MVCAVLWDGYQVYFEKVWAVRWGSRDLTHSQSQGVF